MHTNNPSNGNNFTYGIVWNVRGSSSGYMIQYQFDAVSKITKERYYIDGVWSVWSTQYLPISGGTITGGLIIQPFEHTTKGGLNSYDGLVRFLSYESWDNRRTIFIQTHEQEPNIANSVKIESLYGGYKTYNIYGGHNKPSGQYSGNGSSLTRTIDIGGIGDILIIRNSGFLGFSSNNGMFYITTDGTSGFISPTEVIFNEGVLTMASTNIYINANNNNYYYQLL